MDFYKKSGKKAYQTGLIAEEKAIQYLKKDQWLILNHRYRCHYGEIDIIATKQDWLLFIEVKTRKLLNEALFALNETQRTKLINTASYFLDTNQLTNTNNTRFDLIAIDPYDRIKHIKNITIF